jgi:hypothetical protein
MPILLGQIGKIIRFFCCRTEIIVLDAVSSQVVEAIAGIPFGTSGKPNRTSRSTQRIAEIIKYQHASLPTLPIITQEELRESLAAIHNKQFVANQRKDKILNVYDFFGILRRQNPEITKIVLVTHVDHLRLCAVVAHKFGFQLFIPRDIRSIPYDRHSEQSWARSKWSFSLNMGLHHIGHFWWQCIVVFRLIFKNMV